MDRTTILKGISAMLLLPFALTSPLDETLSLKPRGETKGMWVALCNGKLVSCMPFTHAQSSD